MTTQTLEQIAAQAVQNGQHGLPQHTTIPVAEKLYEGRLQRTGFVNYGIDFDALVRGEVAPPPSGARFDIAFEGEVRGPKFNGRMKGVDYLLVRADGRCDLNMHATITTDDGASIAFWSDGIFVPPMDDSGIAQIRENVRLTTADSRYEWLNRVQIWLTGIIDTAQEEIRTHAYIA
jgi:hypothetical protein